VTDAALKELGRLEQLLFLDLRGTKVTDAALEEFGVAHPYVSINEKPYRKRPPEFENLVRPRLDLPNTDPVIPPWLMEVLRHAHHVPHVLRW
jgi:hypothetical protein